MINKNKISKIVTIHYFDSFNENKIFCNTRGKSTSTENINEVTCKKCLYFIESERLLTARRKNEGKVIANDIYSRYGEEIYNNIYKETQNTETLSSREKLKYLYLEQKQIEKKYQKRSNKNAYWYDTNYLKNDKEIKHLESLIKSKKML